MFCMDNYISYFCPQLREQGSTDLNESNNIPFVLMCCFDIGKGWAIDKNFSFCRNKTPV